MSTVVGRIFHFGDVWEVRQKIMAIISQAQRFLLFFFFFKVFCSREMFSQ